MLLLPRMQSRIFPSKHIKVFFFTSSNYRLLLSIMSWNVVSLSQSANIRPHPLSGNWLGNNFRQSLWPIPDQDLSQIVTAHGHIHTPLSLTHTRTHTHRCQPSVISFVRNNQAKWQHHNLSWSQYTILCILSKCLTTATTTTTTTTTIAFAFTKCDQHWKCISGCKLEAETRLCRAHTIKRNCVCVCALHTDEIYLALLTNINHAYMHYKSAEID